MTMARLKSPTGVLIDVTDELAAVLGAGYTPVTDDAATEQNKPAASRRKATVKADGPDTAGTSEQ